MTARDNNWSSVSTFGTWQCWIQAQLLMASAFLLLAHIPYSSEAVPLSPIQPYFAYQLSDNNEVYSSRNKNVISLYKYRGVKSTKAF
jgi:hypothetical protein